MSDLVSSNDVATNGVNGRISNEFWYKCECCVQMETSTEVVCCLEIPEICNPRFSSTLCLYVCKSDLHFVLWYSRWENFVNYLISTHCWSVGNQNKSFVSLQTLSYYLIRSFFCERIFSKEHPIGFRGSIIIEKQCLIIWIARNSHLQVLKNL